MEKCKKMRGLRPRKSKSERKRERKEWAEESQLVLEKTGLGKIEKGARTLKTHDDDWEMSMMENLRVREKEREE